MQQCVRNRDYIYPNYDVKHSDTNEGLLRISRQTGNLEVSLNGQWKKQNRSASKVEMLKNIEANNFVASTIYADYAYECKIFNPAITETCNVEVFFGTKESLSGNYSPICQFGRGYVIIYSKVNDSIVIPQIKILEN